MSKKKPRIVVDYIEGEGVRSRVDHAYSREHAIWMLAQAIITITTPEQPEVAEVTEHETLPELSDEDKQQPEKDKVPNVLQ